MVTLTPNGRRSYRLQDNKIVFGAHAVSNVVRIGLPDLRIYPEILGFNALFRNAAGFRKSQEILGLFECSGENSNF